ncbi:MAG: hypothetical protein CMM47_00625 [Rhodospirillaceae bacterium]|nr:hypothetical protein [Rhodospirillaceae bacterium]
MQFYNTNDLPNDLAELSYAANIARLFPNGEAPLFAMSGLARKVKALQTLHSYWSKTMQFGAITMGAAATVGATTLTVQDSSTVTVNDILRHSKAFVGGVFTPPELLLVTGITDATTITVVRGFQGTTAAAIPDTTKLAVIGNAYAEGSATPPATSILPVNHVNYTHIFRNGWAQSKTLAAVQQIVGDGTVAENKRDASNFHARDIELATFFSRRGQSIRNGQPLHTMAGLEQLVEENSPTNIKEAGATTTFKQLRDMIDPLFDTRMDGSSDNSRVAYCGKTALNVVNDIGRLSGEYQIVDGQTNFGLKFKTLVLPRGTIRLIEHPIFNTFPDWQKLMVVGELSSFDFAYLEGRDTEVTYINEDKKATDGTDATGGVLTTELTIQLKNPHAWGFIHNLRDAAA